MCLVVYVKNKKDITDDYSTCRVYCTISRIALINVHLCCLQNLTQTPCIESVVVERSKKGRLSTLTCKGDSDLDSSSGGEDCDVETPIDLVSHQKMSFQFYYSLCRLPSLA